MSRTTWTRAAISAAVLTATILATGCAGTTVGAAGSSGSAPSTTARAAPATTATTVAPAEPTAPPVAPSSSPRTVPPSSVDGPASSAPLAPPSAAAPRSTVPAVLVGTWDGGSEPDSVDITFYEGGDVTLAYRNGAVIDATVVVDDTTMTFYLPRGEQTRRWSVEEIDAGSGYVFLNLSLDGFSYVRQIS
jgi:hypothetical protein